MKKGSDRNQTASILGNYERRKQRLQQVPRCSWQLFLKGSNSLTSLGIPENQHNQ
jgi:hypothetical protein